ncbi:MAG: LCP family protein [Defluviitaleaceae bacterium]|nr:LCP family protein [Defluviitaleaceae bacterium]
MKIRKATEWLKYNVLAIKLFFLVAGSIASAAILVSVGVTMVLMALDDGGRPPEADYGEFVFDIDEHEEYIALPERTDDEDDDGNTGLVPARTNFIFIGIDHQQLADAIMVGTFYRDSGNIHLMSVPRDMLVRIPPHRLERMRADGIRPPRSLKVNQMRSHGGQVHGVYYLMEQLAEMFGVSFDFYVEVELAAFRRVVDAIGGVEMYIPRRLWYRCYNPPPIQINVPAGYVLLDGNMAEGVVRYRQWPMGDLQRNQMQMEFMTQLIRQAATREAILNDPMELIRVVHENVRSNLGLGAVVYIPYIPRVGPDSVTTFTMPVTIPNGSVDGITGVVLPNTSLLPDVIADVFYAVFEDAEEETEDEDSDADDEDAEETEAFEE